MNIFSNHFSMKSIQEYVDMMAPIPANPIPDKLPVIPNGTQGQVTWTQEQILNTLKQSVDDIWEFHLNTNNYVIHIALDECYHSLLSYVDQLIEAIKSFSIGLIIRKESLICPGEYEGRPAEYLGNLRSILYYGKDNYWSGFGEILSICDGIDQTISRTCYMIRNLSNPDVPAYPSLNDYVQQCDGCC